MVKMAVGMETNVTIFEPKDVDWMGVVLWEA